jgi:hypothetical protein
MLKIERAKAGAGEVGLKDLMFFAKINMISLMQPAKSEFEINLNCAWPCKEVRPMAIISVLGIRNKEETESLVRARTSETEWMKL